MRIIVALGGNALLRRGEHPESRIQTQRLAAVAPSLVQLSVDHQLVIVHGNGPQVGLLASENATDTSIAAAYPLGDMVAESQGLIGLWLQRSLHNAGMAGPVAALVCQTVVDASDPAWQVPTKYIGPGYSAEDAQVLAKQYGWIFKEDGSHRRRVVPSPAPVEIVEQDIIVGLLAAGVTVIAGGGGGVPVTHDDGVLSGVDAVVDKDSVAALLAIRLDADLLAILTDVPAVMTGFGTPQQQPIHAITCAALEGNTFADGSMGPKVRAAIGFVQATGRRVAIGSLDDALAVVAGEAGTQVRA
ncbi:carbamate kinase [Arthrobacter livingstonensis]|uniref:Carbamate kinase n=1 Tax=Arthrobacter livingstonensis TaxID=670078 RepID=A0A2V5KZP1_9MICC|nr:carbamate kinase [Arthrobacter livingstonensis]PYI64279.1 carbamate kinase [Arthrobacter livingstonensis]